MAEELEDMNLTADDRSIYKFLNKNKSNSLGAIYLKEMIKTNHVQLKEYHASGFIRMCSKSRRFRPFLRLTEG